MTTATMVSRWGVLLVGVDAGVSTGRSLTVRVGRVDGTGRRPRIAGGGVGSCSSRRGSCWRRVG
ncbi:hypothetical protein N4G67_06630 [Streptomyces violarus]|uniref:hypothetical protein n=1 Tax=Streptomyces violarus TaxID=67380 RepID=UPI0021BEBDCF|nr:hypothetical protein [Streptomyces violarus]MCT9138745.1 hypothetical protein [Streptomyces violarus]